MLYVTTCVILLRALTSTVPEYWTPKTLATWSTKPRTKRSHRYPAPKHHFWNNSMLSRILFAHRLPTIANRPSDAEYSENRGCICSQGHCLRNNSYIASHGNSIYSDAYCHCSSYGLFSLLYFHAALSPFWHSTEGFCCFLEHYYLLFPYASYNHHKTSIMGLARYRWYQSFKWARRWVEFWCSLLHTCFVPLCIVCLQLEFLYLE